MFKRDIDAETFRRHHSHMSLYIEVASKVNICFEFFAVSFLKINKTQRSYNTKTKHNNELQRGHVYKDILTNMK